MEYRPIPYYGQEEIDKAVRENNADDLLLMVLSVALHCSDWEYAQNFCVQFSNHENSNVRANAIQGFGHIARIHGKLDEKIIMPIVKKALKDENERVRGEAIDAKDEIKWQLKLIKKIKNGTSKNRNYRRQRVIPDAGVDGCDGS